MGQLHRTKPVMPQYVQKLDQVQLTKAQQEILTVVLRDSRMPENRKFFRVRDVIFEALARDALGAAAYSRVVASATEKATTLLKLINDDAKPSH